MTFHIRRDAVLAIEEFTVIGEARQRIHLESGVVIAFNPEVDKLLWFDEVGLGPVGTLSSWFSAE